MSADFFREQAEYFIKTARADTEAAQKALAEALLILEASKTIATPRLLCSELRALAEKTRRQKYPVIAAHLELIAEQIIPPPAPEDRTAYWWQRD